MLVHHSFMANNMSEEKSLVQLIIDEREEQYYPIHRLDRKTSGIVLFAKTKERFEAFQNILQSETTQKVYFAIVRGHAPASGIIDSPVKGRDANVYKDAYTSFKCMDTLTLDIPVGKFDQSRYSLVELRPKTGRLHQLRIHMNKISHPIVGDPKYGDRFHNRMFIKVFDMDTLLLHANQLHFIHPITSENISIQAPLPPNFVKIKKLFNNKG